MIEDKNISKTPISSLGEFGLIALLTKDFESKNKETILSFGDDAAIVSCKENQQTVVTTDMLVETVHFNLQYTPLMHLGYKSVVVNLSDLVAMGAEAKQILVSVSISNKYTVEAMEELYKGIKAACDNYKVDLIGGDTTSSASGLVISITAIGLVEKGLQILRSGAKENNLIAVTGDLGAAYMGLQILERENKVFQNNAEFQPDLDSYPYILRRQLRPEAQFKLLEKIKEAGVKITSAIDVSDGLSSELLHLSKASKVSVRIYEDKIPLDPETIKTAEEFKLNPILCAMHGGEDYELLFTFPIEDKDKIEKIKDISIIGYTSDISNGNKMITSDGKSEIDLTAQGWDSLDKNQDD